MATTFINGVQHSYFSVTCAACKTETTHTVPSQGLFNYHQGANISDAFNVTEVSATDREAVMAMANNRPYLCDCIYPDEDC